MIAAVLFFKCIFHIVGENNVAMRKYIAVKIVGIEGKVTGLSLR